MSESHKGKSTVGGGGAGGRDTGGVGDDDEDRHGEKPKGKRGILFPFGKSKNGLRRRRNKRLSLSAPSSSNSNSILSAGVPRRGGGVRIGGCGGCFRGPKTLGSPPPPGESPTSDPNDSEFSYELLKTLIEKNDFYSKECNPYLNEMP